MGVWWSRRSGRFVMVLFGALISNFVAGAQTNSATLSGRVRDATGAVVRKLRRLRRS
jgi:hypothetical protein